ncbi:MAG: hypothetical protein L0211_23945 [Planctomycetaceae bacterium]|nr:hypothetical protein [Planctomycetaceae bacterium]
MPSSAVRRSSRRQFFTPLRLEWLERRDCPTGSVSVFGSTSVTEGSQASFGIQGSNLPAGGVTAYYQTVAGTAAEGADYTGLSGSVFLSPTSPMVSLNVNTIADGVYDSGETFSLQLTGVTGDATIGPGAATVTINESGPPPQGPPPGSLTLDPVGDLDEGESFSLTGRITPPAAYTVQASINWGGFATMAGSGASFVTNSDGSFSIANKYYDDGLSPGNGTASDVAAISMTATVTGVQLNAASTATIHNIAPTGTFDLYGYMGPLGGRQFELTALLADTGITDLPKLTVNWGDGGDPQIQSGLALNSQITLRHSYPPTGQTYQVTVTAEDDDLGSYTWTGSAPMYLLDLDNDADNSGEINEADDPIEESFPGAYVGVNADDDNENNIVDMALNEVTPVNNENDLEEFKLRWTPANRPEANNYVGWWVALYAAPSYAIDPLTGLIVPGGIAIYDSPNKQNLIPFVQTVNGLAAKWPAASALTKTLYLEARVPGPITLSLRLLSPSEFIVDGDTVVFTAIEPDGELDLIIHDGQTKKEVLPPDEDKTGAVTVANMNDTDADGHTDNTDPNGVEETRTGADRHGRNEVDLMKLIIKKPDPYFPGTPVTVLVNAPAKAQLWKDELKKIPLPEYNVTTGNATWDVWGAGDKKEVWVEILTPSDEVADISLTLFHGTHEPDVVKATGVWAWTTAEIFSDTNWDALAGTIWRTQMDQKLQNDVEAYGGTGKRGPMLMTGSTDQVIRNVMAMRFTVTPTDVSTVLSRVKFDITRQKELKDWTQTPEELVPMPKETVPWPQLWEVGNDDKDNTDESPAVLEGGHMFVVDDPRLPDLQTPPLTYWQRWRYLNFREFMRVRFDWKRPAGYNPNPTPPPPPPINPNDLYFIDGSQCSGKEPWLSRISIAYLGEAKWQRAGGHNRLEPGELAIGNDP